MFATGVLWKGLVAAGVALAAVLFLAPAGGAITHGQPDGDRHPAVGALVGIVEGMTTPVPYCTGTLVSSTVLVTAAHCDTGVVAVTVTFDPVYTPGSNLGTGTFHASPTFNASRSDPADVAVVVLDRPITGVAPASLPAPGLLDELAARGGLKHQSFTAVGYGADGYTRGGGPREPVFTHTRAFAVGTFNALGPGYLRISQNAAHGDGGTCAGDSGGPSFLGAGATETDVVVGVASTGDSLCTATNVAYRLDGDATRSFLSRYVAVP